MKYIKDLIKRTFYVKRGYVLLLYAAICVGLLCLIIGDIKRHDVAHVIIDGILLCQGICGLKDIL